MVTINIRGLPRTMTENELDNLFSQHGRVFKVRMAKDIFSGQCKGMAQLLMEGHEARAAKQALNGAAVDGSMMQVAVHTKKPTVRFRGH